jgi:hypothetical protein
MEALPDESLYKHESGNTAVDEGYFIGATSAPLQSRLVRRCRSDRKTLLL